MISIKRALKLNDKEATLMSKHAGFRRYVYNMALFLRTSLYQNFKVSDNKVFNEVRKILTNHTKKQASNTWMNELSSRVYQHAIIDLQNAFKRYRKGIASHPTPAKKKDGQSFTVDSSNGKVMLQAGNKIKIPTLGTFRLHEALPCNYITQTFHLIKEGTRWFVSFCVDVDVLPVKQPEESVGIDVGVKTFATLSNDMKFDAPKPLMQAKTKLAKLQRKASKQVKGSQNQKKTYQKIKALYYRIASIRKDFLHKLTTFIAKTFKLVKIEDLNVKGMLSNHKLAGVISDLGFYEFRRQLTYKCSFYGSKLELVNQWFPSSKLCSDCGFKQDMPLSVRTYKCPNCGMEKDRDVNAAINILRYEPSA